MNRDSFTPQAITLFHTRKLDEEEASEAFSQSDADKDGTVTWEEYLLAAYNTDKDKLAELEKQSPKEASELKKVNVFRFLVSP